MSFEMVLEASKDFNELERRLSENITPISVISGAQAQKVHLIYAASKKFGKDILAVYPSDFEARAAHIDYRFFDSENSYFYPSKDYVFYDVDTVSRASVYDRLTVCEQMCAGSGARVVFTSISALMQFSADFSTFVSHRLTFRVGEEHDVEKVLESLVEMGYVREDMVEGVGQFSFRGGILDVFSPNLENPIRVEFFDNEVDSVRFFDTSSQLTVSKVESVDICVCRELSLSESQKQELTDALKGELIKLKRKKLNVDLAIEHLSADIEKISEAAQFSAIDKYVFQIFGKIPSFFDFLSDDTLCFLDEPKRTVEEAKSFDTEFSQTVSELLDRGVLYPSNKHFIIGYNEAIEKLLSYKMVCTSMVQGSMPLISPKVQINFTAVPVNSFHGKIDYLFDDLRDWKRKKATVVILAGGEQRCKSLVTSLNNADIESIFIKEFSKSCYGRINVMKGSISGGFYYPGENFVLISDREIFNENRRRKVRTKQSDENKIRSCADISPGDYVVHQIHGIGRYEGIQKLTTLGNTKDYLKISYHGTDKLYVPTSQIDMLYKYIGNSDRKVSVNRLGGADWNKTKARVKAAAGDMAKGLIALYAAREKEAGYSFSADTEWQRQFEDNFAYTETPDQLKCIEEVKKDMESARPMDRLLLGDVGYGKTEIALRAAFKAVMDSKQVAYLVPTTVLAMQHFNTFQSRMQDFPVRVEMLSRFRTPKQQKETLKRLKTGETDIVIGTHRILQKDLLFHDLGLLIVDEEQRFGVGDKEKLKQIRKNVDVLTLSATPIPRTLQMSMVNIRDMSVISEPPQNRYPVQTFVMDYNEQVVCDAIKKELARGGQVYYLYNKVKSIYHVAERIKELVPEANIGVGHGQMSEAALEDVMYDVVCGNINVLVCTTIIETGLDISNVNTIIIEDADKMGLAQLYQLRGRVGRSNKMAYAYLTYRRDKSLSEVAQKRLSAIREFTEFGSGFKIAMRDLQIRGAGNILGSQQHGHIDAVGYDMYYKILQEAVDELNGVAPKEEINCLIELDVDAHIPESYISNQEQRIDAYKKIASIEDEADYYDIIDELTDRYGDIPKSAMNVITIAAIKAEAIAQGIFEISQKDENVIIKFTKGKFNMESVAKAIGHYKGKLLFSAGEVCYLTLKQKGVSQKELLDNVKILLQMIK